jgi:hypothetical protein
MLGRELRVAVDHHPRLPPAQVLQLIAARTGLPMPRAPCASGRSGNPRCQPSARRCATLLVTPTRSASSIGEQNRGCFPPAFQHRHRISVQRDASRRSVLGLVQPGCPASRSTRSHSSGDHACSRPTRSGSAPTRGGLRRSAPASSRQPPVAPTSPGSGGSETDRSTATRRAPR